MRLFHSPFKCQNAIFLIYLLFLSNSALNAATLTVNTGFETGTLSGLRCSGNCPTVIKNNAASGNYSASHSLNRSMKNPYRTETVIDGKNNTFDFQTEYWMGFSYRYEDWQKDSSAEMAPFQIHTRPSSWDSVCAPGGAAWSAAPFFMASKDDKAKFITYGGKVLWIGSIEKKQWLDIVVHFRLSAGSDGFIEVWKGGVKLGRVNGPNGKALDKCGKPFRTPYAKFGTYKWDWKEGKPATDSTRRQVLLDNIKIAKGSNGYSLVTSTKTISTPLEDQNPIIPPASPIEESLIAHWAVTGTKVSDLSGNGNTSTLVNGAKVVSDEGIRFYGDNDYLDAGKLDVSGNEITISAWFLADDLSNCPYRDCRIISKATGTGEQDHYFMVSTVQAGSKTRLRFRLKTNGKTSTLIATSGDLSENEWVHVTAVYDGEKMRLYKDGVEVGNTAKQGNMTINSNASVWIGGNPFNAKDRPWKGYIDDVQIYSYALTYSEISELSKI